MTRRTRQIARSDRAGETGLRIAIMREIAQWGIDTGLAMWRFDELTPEERIRTPPTPEDRCGACVDDTPAVSMMLQRNDPLFWFDIHKNESGFVHCLQGFCREKPFEENDGAHCERMQEEGYRLSTAGHGFH